MLKNRGVAVVSQRVGIPARRDRSFLLGAKWCGASFQHLERNKRGCLAFKRIRKIFFLLGAKGSRFSFGRQKKQKRQGAVFRTGSPPKKVSVGYLRPLQPENSSYPHKGKDRRKVIVRPLSKGANGKHQQADE